MADSIKQIEQHLPNISFANPLAMQDAIKAISTYYVPSFISDEKSPADVLNKYKTELGYKGDPYKPRKSEGYIYQMFLLAAHTLEQQGLLKQALDESVALADKSPKQREVWQAVVVERRPMFLFATVKQAEIDLQTMIPVWKVLKTKEETGGKGFVFRVGVPSDECGIHRDLPYEIYASPTILEGLMHAYKIFLAFREREKQEFSERLKTLGTSIKLSTHLIYLSRVLQTEEQGQKVVYYFGEDVYSLVRVDPHKAYLLSVRKMIQEGDNQLETYRDYNLLFESSSPISAVLSAEAYKRQVRLVCFPLYPLDRENQMVASLLGFYNHKTARAYEVANVKLSASLTIPSAWAYEFISDKRTAVTVIVPQWEDGQSTERKLPFAYVFQGTLSALATAHGFTVPTEQKKWLSDLSPVDIDPSAVSEASQLIGEIRVRDEEGLIVAVRRDKGGKVERTSRLQFAIDPILDGNETIAAMGMYLVK